MTCNAWRLGETDPSTASLNAREVEGLDIPLTILRVRTSLTFGIWEVKSLRVLSLWFSVRSKRAMSPANLIGDIRQCPWMASVAIL